MNKNFYIIVPLGDSILPSPAGFFSKLLGNGKTREIEEKIQNFEKAKEKLDGRVTSLMANLSGIGIRGLRLKTEEIIQLYYNSYNFGAGPLIDPTQLEEIKITKS